MHLDIVLARLSQHVDHLADDVLLVFRRPLGDLDHHLVVGLAALEFLLRNEDIVHEDVALGHQVGIVLLHLQLTHKGVAGMAQDLGHHGLLDMILPARHHRDAHPVAVEGIHRVALADEDRLAAVVGQERVLAVGLAAEHALLHLSLGVQPVGRLRHLAQEVVPSHLLHDVDGQHLQRMRVEMQLLEYILEGERLVRVLLEQGHQQFLQLFLRDAFTAFLSFCHSRYSLVMLQINKKKLINHRLGH